MLLRQKTKQASQIIYRYLSLSSLQMMKTTKNKQQQKNI